MKIILSYSLCANIRMNLTKSCFLRLNNAPGGPQILREQEKIKILGVTIHRTWAKMIDENYEKIINDMKFSIKLNQTRNLNLLEKIWLLNTFVLSKMHYIAQIIPPRNKHIAQIKCITGKFLWSGDIFRVARDQMYLDYDKGGLKLIDPETKCKALFIRNLLYDKNGGNNEHERYLLAFPKPGLLTKNGGDWLREADSVKGNTNLTSTRQLYYNFLNEKHIPTGVEDRFPQIEWNTIWRNLSLNFLPSFDKDLLYRFVNDIIPNKEKLVAYRIGNLVNDHCEICSCTDNNEHRLRSCSKTADIINWTKTVMRDRLKIVFDQLDDLLQCNIDVSDEQQCAGLWLACHAIAWCLSNTTSKSLFCFKKSISISISI